MNQEKFIFKTSEIIQGDFKLDRLNLMLVFQINCPGCFLYALPAANQLFKQYQGKGVKILALSTAFEDFSDNTLANTKFLLAEGRLVGETKKILGRAGYETLPFKISFDVAFDELKEYKMGDMETTLDQFCGNIAEFKEKNQVEKKLMRGQVREYLTSKTMSAFTFDSNQLMGTPSWILFDQDSNVLFKFFGHKKAEELAAVLEECLKK